MKLLVVDDDNRLRKILSTELCDENICDVEQAECGERAIDLVTKKEFDVMLLDLNLPDIKGSHVLKRIKKMDLATEIIVLTGYGSIESAVEMIKLGAYDYVTKPYELKKLKTVIKKAGERKYLIKENENLRSHIGKCANHHKFETKNRVLLEILDNARNFATCDFPIMLNGETGVGKELLAEEIHLSSKRVNGPFIPVNCGAIPGNIVESELFGHEKGAFTGAHKKKLGLMEIANNGTLFLDEIGDFPIDLQQKFLRALDSKRFFRIGGVKQIEVNVRIVSATNKNLKDEMEQGRFRKDLYYRLSTLTLYLPPLRERLEDLPNLIEKIIGQMNDSTARSKVFSSESMTLLKNYFWPGNVRELQNVVHRTILLSGHKDVIEPEDLSLAIPPKMSRKNRSLEDVEKDYILKVLKEVGGKRLKAAEILGINPKTLYRKLQNLNGDTL
jgi:DNA-binding NtrC family response regulator